MVQRRVACGILLYPLLYLHLVVSQEEPFNGGEDPNALMPGDPEPTTLPPIPHQEKEEIFHNAPIQHMCCRYGARAEKRFDDFDIWLALPQAKNHTGMHEVECRLQVDFTKEKAGCDWCFCLWQEGAVKYEDERYTCCNLEESENSVHTETGWPYCVAETHVFNIKTDQLASCLNNHDQYNYRENLNEIYDGAYNETDLDDLDDEELYGEETQVPLDNNSTSPFQSNTVTPMMITSILTW